ncbi:MAG TPA: GtrA family protein [Anaerolineales bacterium]|nr:GtrA family protein [Anaerolineales bacterium]HMR99108.1 GtrA family protein [Anaerolineales bacterium]HNQ94238.1 GtrA family protein [Anaerolineales bacterium]HNS61462.1 GtrA family protein [Anaerolineales bacterium]
MTALSFVSSTKELTRFARFLAVGALGTALDFSVLTLLKLAGLPTLLANSASFTAGLLNNFTLNRLWTFGDAIHSNWKKQLTQYAVVSLIGLTFNDLIVISLEGLMGAWIGQPEFGYLPAKVIATGVVVFWNYFANRAWTFRVR